MDRKHSISVHLKGDDRDLDRALSSSVSGVSAWEKRIEQANQRLHQTFSGANEDRLAQSAKRAGKKAGDNFAEELVSSVTKALPQGLENPRVIAAVAVLGAALSPVLGAAITSAVLAGLGGAGLAAGIAGAAQDPQVTAAFGILTTSLKKDLADATVSFVDPLVGGFNHIAAISKSILPDMRSSFADLAPVVDLLVAGLGGFIRNMLPGLTAGLRAAKPFLEVFAVWLPQLGDAVGDFFDAIADGGPSALGFWTMFLGSITNTIRVLGILISLLSQTFAGIAKYIPFLGDLVADTEKYAKTSMDAQKAIDLTSTSMAAQETRLDVLSDSWQELIGKGETILGIFDKVNGANQNLFESQTRAAKATADLKDALQESGGQLDLKSEKSLKARDSLLALIKAQQDIVKSTYEQAVADGKSEEASRLAYAAYQQTRQGLENLMVQSGMTREAARLLLEQLYKMPPFINTRINIDGVDEVDRKLEQIRKKFGTVEGAHYAQLYVNEQRTRRQIIEEELRSRRWGGFYEHAAVGTIRDATTFSATSSGRYVIAEPQTGGEAFVPRKGNYGRSMAILSRAAGWYGASVNPGGMAGGNNYNITVNAAVSDPAAVGAKVVEMVAAYENRNGTGWRS